MSDERQVAIRPEQVTELSVADVRQQVGKVQEIMRSVMRQGEHYGVIPGTGDKPTLLKAGAEKLGFTFRLRPEFDIRRQDLEHGHREYEIVCSLYHMGSGQPVGQGVGSCSTMESKYRWRKAYNESEVGPVPRSYWSIDRDNQKARDAELVKTYGPGKYKPKKTGGQWVVMKIEGDAERIENPDIADTYNTVLKMAKKRALVDATITACAASDIFTQDVEDFGETAVEAEVVPDPPAPEQQPPPEKPEEQGERPLKKSGKKPTPRQDAINRLAAIVTNDLVTDQERNDLHAAVAKADLAALESLCETWQRIVTDRKLAEETVEHEEREDDEYIGDVGPAIDRELF